MEDYCKYYSAEWRKRFHKIKSRRYRTEIQGNTLYVLRRRPIWVWLFNKLTHRPNCAVDTIPMCKLKESELIAELKHYGFEIKAV